MFGADSVEVVMNRRQAFAVLGGSVLAARSARPQAAAEKDGGPKAGVSAPPRTSPLICAWSQNLIKVPYPQLGSIAQQIGYDGVDLTVTDNGHVNPRITNVDLVRAFESVRGANLEVPMITTNITSTNDQTAYPILAITGHTQVHLYRLGFWPWSRTPGVPPDIPRRMAEVRADLTNLVTLGRNYQMIAMFPNKAGGYVGEALWDVQTIIADMDPQWIGYYFDPSQAVAEGALSGWEIALRLALPRLKAVAVQDFTWAKTGGVTRMQMCPMGEGIVDWAAFFRILFEAKFTGAISIHQEYQAQDELAAMGKDLEFVRKQVKQAWNGPTN
jgi:sugar phosphate isomerase/epimerase